MKQYYSIKQHQRNLRNSSKETVEFAVKKVIKQLIVGNTQEMQTRNQNEKKIPTQPMLHRQKKRTNVPVHIVINQDTVLKHVGKRKKMKRKIKKRLQT
jgi:hypothetical protein